MLKCSDVVEQASDYLEHELTFQRRFQYRAHLFICRHCRLFSRQFSAAVAMTRRLPEPPVSQHVIDRVKRQLDSQD